MGQLTSIRSRSREFFRNNAEHPQDPSKAEYLVSSPAPDQAANQILIDDIILDNIFPNLDLTDIVALRKVSNQLRRCSNEPAVWKRILASTSRPLPPVPPTERYSLANMTPLEAERLLTRSLSLPERWDRTRPQHFRRWEIDARRRVLEMALLPGGHYLVASIADHQIEPTRHCIEVYTSDFNYSMGFPVARLKTPTKAFHLRAKYLSIHGQPGITIVYVRREYRRERFKEEFDINTIAPDSDLFSSQVKYECTVVHVTLHSLELLFDNDKPWNAREYRTRALQQDRPFQILADITSRARMDCPVLEQDRTGTPLIAVLKHPDRILYKNLDGGLGRTMLCTPHPSYQDFRHAILAFTFVPSQHQFLVIRRAGVNPASPDFAAELAALPHDMEATGPYYFAELYDLQSPVSPAPTAEPLQTQTQVTCIAAARSAVHDAEWRFWHRVWITEPGMGLAARAGGHGEGEGQKGAGGKPPPITLFVQADRSYGLVFNTFFPERVNPDTNADTNSDTDTNGDTNTEPQYRYILSEEEPFIETEQLPEDIENLNDIYEHRVLLGSTRPVVYSIPRKGRRRRQPGCFHIRMLGGVWDEGLLDRPPLDPEEPAAGTGDNGDVQDDDAGAYMGPGPVIATALGLEDLVGPQEDGEEDDEDMPEAGMDSADEHTVDDELIEEHAGREMDEDMDEDTYADANAESGADIEINSDEDADEDQNQEGQDADSEDGQSDILASETRIRISHQFNIEFAELEDVSAVAWDETIGRLCVANDTKIAVFDFAGAPVPAPAVGGDSLGWCRSAQLAL